MIEIVDKAKCCGCTACASICPKNAIEMKPDEEGFLYPEVNNDKCIHCGLCDSVCPEKDERLPEKSVPGYIVRHKSEEILAQSTSGGAFTAFANAILATGGSVFGVGYDQDMRVVNKKTVTSRELQEMRGSKFVQSYLGNTFCAIKQELANNRKVLFVGTPCQVEGLLAYLQNKPDNLYCIDFVCRGVTSPALWQNYVQMMQDKFGAKIIGAQFKHKTYGHHATTMKIDFDNGKTYYGSGRVDPMMKAFVTELASRPSCYSCAFKTVNRKSDITMFDCYRFSKITGKRDDNRGYSSVLVHSEKGMTLFAEAEKEMYTIPAEYAFLVAENGIMVRHSARPNVLRKDFYEAIQVSSCDSVLNELLPISKKDWFIEKIKKFFYKIGLIQEIKRIRENANNMFIPKK